MVFYAHEMGHTLFGLPDLYDTDYSSNGLGNWSLMAGGSWNGPNNLNGLPDGSSPAFPDAWSHSQMGYLTPIIVSTNISNQTINSVENTPEIYLLWNNLCGSEYFLIENRQQINYDVYLPGNGLCIYHIDNSVINNNYEWYPGNTSSGHYHIALEQADGLWNLERKQGRGDEGDPYPGSSNNLNFNNYSIPDSKNYNLNETGIEVDNISSSSLTMTADLKIESQISLPQFSEQLLISLKSGNSVIWGDYDNDSDLDILLTTSDFSKIYRNNGDNTFTEQNSISLIGAGSAAWGDYDNDGDLDILLTNGSVSKIYRNDGDNTFTDQTSISLVGASSAAWGDYDNDGDLDIILGQRIYRNNGDNTFTEQTSISLTDVSEGSAAWGDYDNDGDLDILLTGGSVSKIYRNNGDNTFTDQESISLVSSVDGTAVWGDYDNDGDLDILLTGYAYGRGRVSIVYQNNGNNTFTEQTSISLIGVNESSAVWGDYDNDGDLDILLTGYHSGDAGLSKVYKNNGNNTFTLQTSIYLVGIENGSVAWGDYDNDGDLDIILTGNSNGQSITKIYRNNNMAKNLSPSVPSNLHASVNGNDVTFSWDKSTDNETTQNGLTYNVLIGTSPGSCDILSPLADLHTGKRRIVSMGNAGHRNFKTIKGLSDSKYYWSVQAIDNCFAGSNFASEQSFTIQSPGTIIITYPKGGEKFAPGNNPIITYSSVGNSGYVNLDYSTDGGITWNTIATHQLDDGDYRGWIVPNTPSANCKIKISDVDGDPTTISNVFTISSNEFTEQTSISLPGDYPATWGDYDNDGDLDILLSGSIYRNNGNNIFTEQDISLEGGSGAWGDYDNDGDLDIVLTQPLQYHTSSLNLYP